MLFGYLQPPERINKAAVKYAAWLAVTHWKKVLKCCWSTWVHVYNSWFICHRFVCKIQCEQNRQQVLQMKRQNTSLVHALQNDANKCFLIWCCYRQDDIAVSKIRFSDLTPLWLRFGLVQAPNQGNIVVLVKLMTLLTLGWPLSSWLQW